MLDAATKPGGAAAVNETEYADHSKSDAAARLERQLEVAQQITHIGSWEWDIATNAVTWSDELYRIYGLEPRSVAITFEFFLARVHPEDRERIQAAVGEALARGGRFAYPERILRPDGSIRVLDTVGEALVSAHGRPLGLIGSCRDVTEQHARDEERARDQRLRDAEQRILEMIVSGAPLPSILAAIVVAIEAHCPGTIGSILLVDTDGKRLRHGAAPNLPALYNEVIDGSAVGPTAGSCGTAAHRRAPVYSQDIETDPLWEDYRHLARPFGLRACWSMPVLANDNRVLGTFAFYFTEPKIADEDDVALISRASHLAGIAIERRQLEDQLRALSEHVESVREEERTGIAREIHDDLGQSLTAFKMDIAWLTRRLVTEGAAAKDVMLEKLKGMSELADDVIGRVRRISSELRPGVLDDLGLVAAIEWQALEFEERTGTPCRIHSDLWEARLERKLSTAIFRIFQEALTNIARHAEAKLVEVSLTRQDGTLRLEVRDDGRGITPEEAYAPSALGLLGIRERARQLGGTASVHGAESGGTVVEVDVPFAEVAEVAP